jgi:hypothetical protein
MAIFDKFDEHNRLMGRMADRLGVDLGDALVDGRLGEPDLRRMMFSCLACREPGACRQFLDDKEADTVVAPGFCNNREVMNRLAWRD